MNQHRPFDIQHVRVARPDHTGALVSSHDALFAMLDGQVIRGCQGAWRAEVVSILEEQGQTWVQISPARKPGNSVVMRLTAQPRADEALQALRAWSDLPDERRPAVIDLVAGR